MPTITNNCPGLYPGNDPLSVSEDLILNLEAVMELSAEVTILLVDDEVNVTKSLRRLLQECEQLTILTAQSGAEGLRILQEEPQVGVIISDQRMPEMTGDQFLAKAREIVPDAARILLTGYADIDASIAAVNQGGISRYLTKPWNDDVLIDAVTTAAEGYLLIQENRRLNKLVRQQKKELEDWNQRLKQRVLDQTSQIRAKSDTLAETNQHLRESLSATIDAMSAMIELRHTALPGHSRNVSTLLAAMAEILEMDPTLSQDIVNAGLLHDIGKIGDSSSPLNKAPQQLNSQELAEYRNHVIRGQAVLDRVPALRNIGTMIRHHHENFDGSGFPDGLQGEDIPFGSRLIAVANQFDRVLQQQFEHTEDNIDAATEQLNPLWGTILDPSLKQALVDGAHRVFGQLSISSEGRELQLSPKQLEPGMKLLADLHTGSGVLLLGKGTIFDENSIEAIRRCAMIDPFDKTIHVLTKE